MYRISETELTRRFLGPLARGVHDGPFMGSSLDASASLDAGQRSSVCLGPVDLPVDLVPMSVRRAGAPAPRAQAPSAVIRVSSVMMARSSLRQLPTSLFAEPTSPVAEPRFGLTPVGTCL